MTDEEGQARQPAWQRATLADCMADRVIFRNLEPVDPHLPGLQALWREAGLDHFYVPRKTAPEYADVVVRALAEAQRLRGVREPLGCALFLGDTLMNDGTAARHIGAHLPMRGFIGAERPQEPPSARRDGDLLIANRWTALDDFIAWVREEGLPLDERTALLIDLDKTIIGARGRNDRAIDEARLRAVLGTMREALGEDLCEADFRAVYDALNQPAHHHFTADNQDYLAYICLMVTAGVCPAEELWERLERGALTDVVAFAALCEERRATMPAGPRAAHDEVRQGLAANDPTPFKAFRRREYQETVRAMDALPDEAPLPQLLREEILITAEVFSVARQLGAQGALVFGLSDKPDEASLPTAALAAEGYVPLHRVPMKVYGEAAL